MSLLWDANTDYLAFTAPSAMGDATAMTVCAWLYPTSLAGGYLFNFTSASVGFWANWKFASPYDEIYERKIVDTVFSHDAGGCRGDPDRTPFAAVAAHDE